MKFGKNLARVVELSDPEWAPFWINYKFLKKKIKALESTNQNNGVDTVVTRTVPEAIAQSNGEVAFYKLLKSELRKCSKFFTSVEAQCIVRRERVREAWRQLTIVGRIIDGNPHRRTMEACVMLYRDLLLLENYAIMNYCGLSKILKKHDKITGFLTREHFMKNVANLESFVLYPNLINMLVEMEKLFKDIEGLGEPALITPQLSEEQLFIDTIRTINAEAFCLQQEEGADIGLNTPEFSQQRNYLKKESSRTGTEVGNGNVPAVGGQGGGANGNEKANGSSNGCSHGSEIGASVGLNMVVEAAENVKGVFGSRDNNGEGLQFPLSKQPRPDDGKTLSRPSPNGEEGREPKRHRAGEQ